jgi:hypothetical protein
MDVIREGGKIMFRPLLTATLLLAASAAMASEDVPALKVEESCRAAAAISDGKLTSEERCLSQEHSARAELAEQWSQFDRNDQRLCTAQTSIGGLPSYIELLTCVTMARDARVLRTQGRAER